MRVFFFVALIFALAGCQNFKDPEQYGIPVLKPMSEYPAEITTRDALYFETTYIDKTANSGFNGLKQTVPVEKYTVNISNTEQHSLAVSLQDGEMLANFKIAPVKSFVNGMDYNEWFTSNSGKGFHIDMNFYDKKAQGYPANVDLLNESGAFLGDMNTGKSMIWFDILPRQMVNPKTNQMMNIDRIVISVVFSN